MLLPKKDKFIAEVLSHIKFPFDKEDIKTELEHHILDKMEYYNEQGYDEEEAEQLSVHDMGDAGEIGVELNKQHNPFIGWVWVITNVLVLFSVCVLAFSLIPFFSSLAGTIPQSNIIYTIDLDEQVKIDDRVIKFTHVIYEKNGSMNIIYEHYDTRLWASGWGFHDIGEIEDNLGNKYWVGSSSSRGGIKTRSIRTVNDFSAEADTLIIDYDEFNRRYRLEINLPIGDQYE